MQNRENPSVYRNRRAFHSSPFVKAITEEYGAEPPSMDSELRYLRSLYFCYRSSLFQPSRMFGFDFHIYLTDMMVSNRNPQFLWHALPKDKELQAFIRKMSQLPYWVLFYGHKPFANVWCKNGPIYRRPVIPTPRIPIP